MTHVITKTQSYPAFKWGFFWGDEEPLFSGQVAQNVENNSSPPVSKSQRNTPNISFKLLVLSSSLFISFLCSLIIYLYMYT